MQWDGGSVLSPLASQGRQLGARGLGLVQPAKSPPAASSAPQAAATGSRARDAVR